MSEPKIPEDLRVDYEAWKQGRTARYDIKEWMSCACRLIERIAALQAESTELLELVHAALDKAGALREADGVNLSVESRIAALQQRVTELEEENLQFTW